MSGFFFFNSFFGGNVSDSSALTSILPNINQMQIAIGIYHNRRNPFIIAENFLLHFTIY